MTKTPDDPPPPQQPEPTPVPPSEVAYRLVFFLVIQVIALACFAAGFFLTRFEVPHSSQCQDASTWMRSHNTTTGVGCWYGARFRRAVLVVIDALRLDFADGYSEEEVAMIEERQPSAHYHLNQLPVIQELLQSRPLHSLLYRFEADPPTTTMQRLKGMTTGSLPTFIDFRQNFQSPAIVEDNLIRQLQQQGKRLTVMGDDTWSLLFPEAFNRSFPYPSFNTRDIDTVDNGVLVHLQPEMARDDWDVLIAHFLGVDHVGHTYGPSHAAMKDKLRQMDQALRYVIDALQEDTLLLVMGDHGMTDDGNHGGATEEETGAALFIHSRGSNDLLVPSSDPGSFYLWSRDRQQLTEGGPMQPHAHTHQRHGDSSSSRSHKDLPEVSQVDLVPTLALLLGVPIPYANLGGVIPELFFTSAGGYEGLADAFHVNAKQVSRYLEYYSTIARMPQEDLDQLDKLYQDITSRHQQAESGAVDVLGGICADYREYLRQALELGRRVWTQYDEGLMLGGVAALLTSLLAATTTTMSSLRTTLTHHTTFPYLLLVSTIAGMIVSCISALLVPSHLLFNGPRGLLILTTTFLSTTSVALCLSSLPPLLPSPTRKGSCWSCRTCLNVLVVGLHGASLFSNSFIEAEHSVYLFLSSTVITINLLGPVHRDNWTRSLGWVAMAFVGRIAFEHKGHGQDVLSHLTLHGTVIPLVALVWLCTRLIPSRAHWGGLAFTYAAIWLYWLSQTELDHEHPSVAAIRLGVPRAVYIVAKLVGVASFFSYRGDKKKKESPAALYPVLITMTFWSAAPIMLVLGPASPLTLLCLACQSLLFARSTILSSSSPLDLAILLTCLGRGYFFATGHHNQFNRLQYSAAFVGFDDFNMYIGGSLLFLNTLGTEMLWAMVTAILCLSTTRGGLPLLGSVYSWMMVMTTLRTFLTSLCVTIQRRHLMVWAIFAPKFIFDSVLHVVSSSFSLAVYLIAWYLLSRPGTTSVSHGISNKEA